MYRNYKILMKKIKDDMNRWRDAPCFWVGRINTVEMTILPNTIDRFNAILIILPMAFFYRMRTKNFTIHRETQKTLNSQSNLKKNEYERISLPNFRLYYKATVIKTVWH